MKVILKLFGLLMFGIGLALTGLGSKAPNYDLRHAETKGAFSQVAYSGAYKDEGILLMLAGGGSFIFSFLLKRRRPF